MEKRVFFLAISLFLTMSVHSQNILTDVSKYDLNKIENQMIEKTRKLLKTDKERNLHVFTFFTVKLSNYFLQEASTVDDFDTYFKLYDKEIGTADNFLKNFQLRDKYISYVYDDSLKKVAMGFGKDVSLSIEGMDMDMYIKYIIELNPEYVFLYIYSLTPSPMYFCYKDGGIIIVSSDDSKNIVSYPFSEIKDWEWLNTEGLYGHSENKG